MSVNHTAHAAPHKTRYTALVHKEESLPTSWLRPFSNPRVRTSTEARRELDRPCGRFKSLSTIEDALRSFIAEKALESDILPESLLVGDGTPLNWQRLLNFLHEHGVIAEPRFSPRPYRNDYPRIAHFLGLLPKLHADGSDGHDVIYGGFGGSPDPEIAMSKSVGEALERHFLSVYKRDAFRSASYAELARFENTLDLASLDYFLPWQKERFHEFAYDEDSVLQWVEGRELMSGSATNIPAQLVYWNYVHAPKGLPREKTLFHQTTSGAGGHFTRDEALLSALLELIERDAFLVHWMNSLSPKVIDTDTIPDDAIRSYVKVLRQFQLRPVFLDTTSDLGIPCATCVMIDESDPMQPMLGIGSSAGFSFGETILASMLESLIVLHSLTFLEPYLLPEKYEPFTSMKISRTERLRAWQAPHMFERFKFFLSGVKQDAAAFIGRAEAQQTPQQQLSFLTDTFSARGTGYEIYTFDVKHTVLDRLGYHVVRAFVPSLVPLHLIEYVAPLNARRLKDAPAKIGYKAAEKFNPWPHPFP